HTKSRRRWRCRPAYATIEEPTRWHCGVLGLPMNRRAAYELLTTLELRLLGTDLTDISPDVHRVTWSFLLNEYVIPRLHETGRIDARERAALDALRHQRFGRPSDEDGETWADIHELMLCHYPVHMMFDEQRAYRGQAEDWPLVPTILRGNPSRAELDARL